MVGRAEARFGDVWLGVVGLGKALARSSSLRAIAARALASVSGLTIKRYGKA